MSSGVSLEPSEYKNSGFTYHLPQLLVQLGQPDPTQDLNRPSHMGGTKLSTTSLARKDKICIESLELLC